MVERYKQPGLPSLVVGTPGVDPSAGKAAAEVAQLSRQSVAEQGQFATQEINAGSAQVEQMEKQGFNAAENIQYNRRIQANLQADLQASLAKPALDAQINTALAQAKANNTVTPDNPNASPLNAVTDWNKNIAPQLMSNIQQQYADNPLIQKKMVGYAASMVDAGVNHLQSWAPTAISAQIDSQLKQIPAQVSDSIGKIDPTQPVDSQRASFQTIMNDATGPYAILRQQSQMFPGKVAEIDTAAMNLHQTASKQFVQNGISSIPDDASGLAQVDQWKAMVQHPENYGLNLGGEDKSTLLGQINTQKEQSIKTQVAHIQSDASLGKADIQNLQWDLSDRNIYNDPNAQKAIHAKLDGIATDLKSQYQQLEAQQVPDGSPEAELRKAKLIGLGQQMGQLVGAGKQTLSEGLSVEQLARTMVTYAHSQEMWPHVLEGIVQRDVRFQQGQADRNQRLDQKQATKDFNVALQAVRDDEHQLDTVPFGAERLAKAQEINNKLIDVAGRAFDAGVINSNSAKGITAEGADLIKMSNFKTTSGIFGWGAKAVPLTGEKDRVQGALDANQMAAQAFALYKRDTDRIKTLTGMVSHNTVSEDESDAVQQYLNTSARGIIAGARKKGVPEETIDKQLPAMVARGVMLYRNGQLSQGNPMPATVKPRAGEPTSPRGMPASYAPPGEAKIKGYKDVNPKKVLVQPPEP